MNDFAKLRKAVVAQMPLRDSLIHGPAHLDRVESIGLRLARKTGADKDVVRLFALFHDSRRENDGTDSKHGERGAELAKSWRDKRFKLDDERMELLVLACSGHADGRTSSDPTIGTCWDADRLNLPRVGVTPERGMLSTEAAMDFIA